MPIRHAANRRRGTYVTVAAAVTMTAAMPFTARAGAPTGQSVFDQMVAAYANVKSFSCSITTVQSGKLPSGKPATVTTTEQIKYKAPNLFRLDSRINGNAPMFAQGPIVETKLSDGHNVYEFAPTKKLYRMQAAPPTIALSQVIPVVGKQPNATFSVGAAASLGGHAAYTVLVKPNLTPQQQAALKGAQPVAMVIDKSTYRLLQLTIKNTALSTLLKMDGQSFNPSIAGSAFNWSPPAGYHVAPQQQAPGGAPIPGGAPRR